MKKIAFILLVLVITTFTACTSNQRAKNWGGKATLDLPKGQKLVLVTWKDADLWYLTRDMTPEDTAIVYNFSEKSNWGAMEGNYTITEHK